MPVIHLAFIFAKDQIHHMNEVGFHVKRSYLTINNNQIRLIIELQINGAYIHEI